MNISMPRTLGIYEYVEISVVVFFVGRASFKGSATVECEYQNERVERKLNSWCSMHIP